MEFQSIERHHHKLILKKAFQFDRKKMLMHSHQLPALMKNFQNLIIFD